MRYELDQTQEQVIANAVKAGMDAFIATLAEQHNLWAFSARKDPDGTWDPVKITAFRRLRDAAAEYAEKAYDASWPYNADEHDPLAAQRIPVVTSPYPGWRYEIALMISTGDDPLWGPALRPDDAEVAMLVSYLEYRMEYYNATWKAKMRRRRLDTDDSTNTVIFRKAGPGDWRYRRESWRTGPLMVPSVYDGEEPVGLEALLDRINDLVPAKWAAWKAAHPEAFGGKS